MGPDLIRDDVLVDAYIEAMMETCVGSVAYRVRSGFLIVATGTALLAVVGGCGVFAPGDDGNDTNPDGAVAEYVGAATCLACHTDFAAGHERHGHAHALSAVERMAPSFPPVGSPVGVSQPPAGFAWLDVSYLIGGYAKSAKFVDVNGYVLTDGRAGVPTQYNLANTFAQLPAMFVSFRPDRTDLLPFAYDEFKRRTTGAQTLAQSDNTRQDNRPGIEGAWAELGVQCEACHGPGSLHVPNPEQGRIVVDGTAEACAVCHTAGDWDVIGAEDRFLQPYQQYSEVQASPHHGFACTVCHDPHRSVLYDRDEALRNTCQSCHGDQNMAFHADVVFTWGDHEERMTCQSCHMPLAVKTGSALTIDLPIKNFARVGDTRTHIMRIDTDVSDPLEMFSDDGTRVAVDEAGMASITACTICQRCHHGLGNAFALTPREGCDLSVDLHGRYAREMAEDANP